MNDRAVQELNRIWASTMAEIDGWARQQLWDCPDGWIVGYTTEPVHDGPPDITGKFVTLAYKPIGKGARSGKPTEWERVYRRGFAKRKTARARAEALYEKHSKAVPRG
jgi:hypothetical protein